MRYSSFVISLLVHSPRIIVPRFSQLHARLRSVHGRRVETGHFLGMPISTIRRLRQGKEPVGPVHSELLDFPPLPRRHGVRISPQAFPPRSNHGNGGILNYFRLRPKRGSKNQNVPISPSPTIKWAALARFIRSSHWLAPPKGIPIR